MDFEAVLRLFDEKDVEVILIGGLACILQGSVRSTEDIDYVYNRSPENLEKLVGALNPYNPYLRGAPPGLPFRFDVSTLRMGLNFTLSTELGSIDLLGEVAGYGFYDDLLPFSDVADAYGVRCRVASVEALIRMKRAAGRPKDFESIALLETVLRESKLENEE